MKFFRIAYKIFCYALVAACISNLLLLGVSMIMENKIVQYRVPDSSRFATESYYTTVEYMQNILATLVVLWVPLSLVMLLIANDRPMATIYKIGIIAFVCGVTILRWDPFGIWFYIWD